ncbi:iron-containing redox enzyme family protein [Streptantibioticus silvisoli]|uniref:Iron-containing redox enzyme family protein n=1 Tax=Streptantibioticus silvisoli TaxID=2705255 RepID=A0ABT6W261_9ACTN|nr:iron-containing redox enzyme family protein [Streptantibioticus silvisoli]MDI5964384.1 iron-containing redox enzyme family protein [Streptantibioticus silvisoli]
MRMPQARGPLSQALTSALADRPGGRRAVPMGPAGRADPYGEDLQLALYLCYELHYRGIDRVADDWEWDPRLLDARAALERRFLAALRRDVPRHPDVASALAELLVEPAGGTGVSAYLRDEGEHWQLREYAALRSLYHLKEADPHAWVLPRLTGRAKAGMVAVEYDEFGAGHADRAHSQLFAELMTDLGLDAHYGRYLESGTADVLATVNLMSLLGLHRGLRGGLVGHFAAVEIASSPGSRRLAQAMERTGAGPAAVGFYTEHVEADAVHEQLVRHEVIGGLLEQEPGLEPDVVLGLDATVWLEDRLGDHLMSAWRTGHSAVRVPL